MLEEHGLSPPPRTSPPDPLFEDSESTKDFKSPSINAFPNLSHSFKNHMNDQFLQRKTIKRLLDLHSLKEGETWHPIALKWWQAWTNHVRFEDDDQELGDDPSPGPIDNSDLSLEPCSSLLQQGLEENIDFKLVHSSIWKLLQDWFGGGPDFPRKVITRGVGKIEAVELYPLVVKLYKCLDDGSPSSEYSIHFLSGRDHLKDLIDSKYTKHRLWVFHEESDWKCLSKSDLERTIESLGLDGEIRVMDEEKGDIWKREGGPRDWKQFEVGQLIDAKDREGKWFEAVITELEEDRIHVHYNGWESKWDEWIQRDSLKLAQVRTHTTGPYIPRTKSQYSSYSSGWSVSHEEGDPIEKGVVGLRNLGNTCFMNSTLQCLSSAKDLLQYWLKDEYKLDLNKDNPLGWQGKVAEAYGELMHDLWEGKYRVVVPRAFKTVIGEFAPRFSGYNQQDSSELLGFLLDGLHEDLNRIQKKPYTEAVEDKGRPDAIVAEESWKVHRLRHDSVIVDTFQGQLKSRLQCPQCDFVSITFDPFMYLSVPLPTVKEKVQSFVLLRSDGSKAEKSSVQVNKMGSVFDLKKSIAEKCDVRVQRLIVGEIWKDRLYKIFTNDHMVNDIRPLDVIWVWEVPVMDEMSEQQENERNLGYVVHSVSFCTLEEDSSWLQGKSSRVQLIGQPLPVVLRKGVTKGKLVKAAIFEVVKSFLGPGTAFEVRTRGYGDSISDDPIEDEDEVDSCEHFFGIVVEKEEDLILDRFEAGEDEGMDIDEIGSTRIEEESIALGDCFATFTEDEVLSQSNAWYCSRCKDFRCASKKMEIWKLPKVLIIHLKRFQFSRLYRDKIDTFVDFPIQGLDLSSSMADSSENPGLYDLFGVSNHVGGLGGGHYTAIKKSLNQDIWYDISDSHVSLTSKDNVKTSSAYVLFYALRNRE